MLIQWSRLSFEHRRLRLPPRDRAPVAAETVGPRADNRQRGRSPGLAPGQHQNAGAHPDRPGPQAPSLPESRRALGFPALPRQHSGGHSHVRPRQAAGLCFVHARYGIGLF